MGILHKMEFKSVMQFKTPQFLPENFIPFMKSRILMSELKTPHRVFPDLVFNQTNSSSIGSMGKCIFKMFLMVSLSNRFHSMFAMRPHTIKSTLFVTLLFNSLLSN